MADLFSAAHLEDEAPRPLADRLRPQQLDEVVVTATRLPAVVADTPGARVIDDWDLADIARYIDWTPFFQTWELKGVYPRILEDEKQGEAARALFAEAKEMLARIIEGRWFNPRAVVGFWPANAVGDDIRLFTGEDRQQPLATLHTLRQQVTKRGDRPNVALSDFVAPEGRPDYVGGFVVTAGPEESEIAARYERANDDYAAIMVKALADRIAEAITAAKDPAAKVEMIVKDGDQYRTVLFDYHDGLRYPHLERIEGTPDRLGDILTPRRR